MKKTLDYTLYSKKARECVAEGCVLLRNESNLLPLKNKKVSVFGRIMFHYINSGTGSGGLVNTPYIVSILEGLEQKKEISINGNLKQLYLEWLKSNPFDYGQGWAQEPWCQKEMEIDLADVIQAKEESDVAIIIIGRLSGEDKDNSATEGSYFLTKEEHALLQKVTSTFEDVVVLLNVGNIIDMQWVEQYKPKAVMYAWQGGCEGGNGIADVIVGDVTPSGKLPDTIARDIADYPSTKNFGHPRTNIYEEDIYVGYRYFETFAKEKVLYPFGYGLSYTEFKMNTVCTVENAYDKDKVKIYFDVTVKNVGDCNGKEVIQIYLNPPQGKLGKSVRNLVAFKKTKELATGDMQTLRLEVELSECASYDDSGVTTHPFCYVLEAGNYEFYVGNDVRSAKKCGEYNLSELIVVKILTQQCAPIQEFKRIIPYKDGEQLRVSLHDVPLRSNSYIPFLDGMKKDINQLILDEPITLMDVYKNKATLDDFVNQISNEALIHMTRGEGMCSPKVTSGTAGAFGGVSEELEKLGIPMACCADGPSGIRMDSGTIAFSVPNGTMVAASFNEELSGDIFEYVALELNVNKIDTLLGPGMNIHRSPLNGRNFEYFSEDPLLTGKMAAAQLRKMHENSVTGTMKHFACNNQEYKRTETNSIVSERALREIYLKGYEIAVKEADAFSIMSTYGAINGICTASNFDLLTGILRNEWGYNGIVMTDWWAKMNFEGEEAATYNTPAMIKAQNDLYMVVCDAKSNSMHDYSETGLEKGIFTREHLLRNAKNICNFMFRTGSLFRKNGNEIITVVEKNKWKEKEDPSIMLPDVIATKDGTNIDTTLISTSKGMSTCFILPTPELKYRIELKMRAKIVGVAQIPLTIYNNNSVMKMIVLNNQYCEDVVENVTFEAPLSVSSYIKFYFGESGIVLESVKVFSE